MLKIDPQPWWLWPWRAVVAPVAVGSTAVARIDHVTLFRYRSWSISCKWCVLWREFRLDRFQFRFAAGKRNCRSVFILALSRETTGIYGSVMDRRDCRIWHERGCVRVQISCRACWAVGRKNGRGYSVPLTRLIGSVVCLVSSVITITGCTVPRLSPLRVFGQNAPGTKRPHAGVG